MKSKEEIYQAYDVSNISIARLVGVIVVSLTIIFAII